MDEVFPRRPAWVVALLLPAVLGMIAYFGAWGSVRYPLGTMAGGTLLSLLAICAITDLCWHKIPNWATYPAMLWAIVLNSAGTLAALSGESAHEPRLMVVSPAGELPPSEIATSGGWYATGPAWLGAVGIGWCLLAAASIFVLMIAVHVFARGAAGDVKLAATIAALLGLQNGLLAVCFTYILAGVYGLVILIWKVGPKKLLTGAWMWLVYALFPRVATRPPFGESEPMKWRLPMAGFFALGTLLVFVPIPGVTTGAP